MAERGIWGGSRERAAGGGRHGKPWPRPTSKNMRLMVVSIGKSDDDGPDEKCPTRRGKKHQVTTLMHLHLLLLLLLLVYLFSLEIFFGGGGNIVFDLISGGWNESIGRVLLFDNNGVERPLEHGGRRPRIAINLKSIPIDSLGADLGGRRPTPPGRNQKGKDIDGFNDSLKLNCQLSSNWRRRRRRR